MTNEEIATKIRDLVDASRNEPEFDACGVYLGLRVLAENIAPRREATKTTFMRACGYHFEPLEGDWR